METAGVEPAPPRCKRGAPPSELHPLGSNVSDADGWSRTTTARGTAFTARGAHRLLSVRVRERQRWPTGFEPAPTGLTTPGASVTPRPPRSGDDRTRTGGLSPDKRALCSSELRPRRVRGWDSNPRSRAHEAREDNRSSTAQSGWQESNLRSPAPEAGGVACSPTARSEHRAPPVGLEPAASALRARRHRRFDHRGIDCRAR
jgi:hypothetical protein